MRAQPLVLIAEAREGYERLYRREEGWKVVRR
jgi:hypothetical protein